MFPRSEYRRSAATFKKISTESGSETAFNADNYIFIVCFIKISRLAAIMAASRPFYPKKRCIISLNKGLLL